MLLDFWSLVALGLANSEVVPQMGCGGAEEESQKELR